jgi:uroporphyrinogen-III synthase
MNPHLPLAGRRIVVTRPAGQAAGLAALIRQAGGEPLELPAIAIRDLADLASFHAVADRLESFDCAIFVSRNAVRKALALLEERGAGKPWPAQLRVATVGAGSREELEARGFTAVIAPAGQADSEALLALPEFTGVAGRRIAIFRGEGGRQYLGETLAARGAVVEYAACYRRTLPAAGRAALAEAWAGGKVDAVLVSSAEGLANLLEMLGDEGPRRLAGTALFVPHLRVAEDAARRGLGRALVAGPGDEEVAAALVAYFGGASYN